MARIDNYASLFGLAHGHRLRQQSRQQVERDGVHYETRWLNEFDTDNRLVARYRTWQNVAQNPPYRRQTGWEKYSLAGDLIDREVRYSKRESTDYVH